MPEAAKVLEAAPLNVKRKSMDAYEAFLERNQHEEIEADTPTERRHFIIREEYARRMADSEADGRQYLSDPKFIGWAYEWTPNAQQVWFCLKAEGISLLPLFPFLHYFLDFADPFRKLAVLIEEKANPWLDAKVLQEQDMLLGLAGWTVYRIPDAVANTYETTLLPEQLGRCPYNEFEDDDQFHEYQEWRANLNMDRTTVDGFFGWLKKEAYSKS